MTTCPNCRGETHRYRARLGDAWIGRLVCSAGCGWSDLDEGPPCATCAHPRVWHEPDPDTGEGPLECSPPDCSVCPCSGFAASRVEEGQG
jgi:hypothetical protein